MEVSKATTAVYAIIDLVFFAMITIVSWWLSLHVGKPKRDPTTYVVVTVIVLGSINIFLYGKEVKNAPSQDTNIAYINTDYLKTSPLGRNIFKIEDLENGTTKDESGLLYNGHDLEKTINGNKYYVFKLSQTKSDKMNAEEIAKKYNKKYGKSIKPGNLMIIKSKKDGW